MREIEKALLRQIERQQQDMLHLFNTAVNAVEGPPSPHDIRLQALAQAVKARGEGVPTETVVETAKGFENYLKGASAT